MSTIKSSGDIEHIFKHGERFNDSLFTLLVDVTPEQRDQGGRVAFVAGKKIGNAVFRNKCKRVMRASVSRLQGPWEGHDLVFIAHHKIATASADAIDKAIARALKRARVTR